MTTELLIATHNRHKTSQISLALGSGWTVTDLHSVPELSGEIPETGVTFEANARIKAEIASRIRPESIVLADDSGLCVDVLMGRPGVFSARFAGPNATDEENNRELLRLLEAIGERDISPKAHYECWMALARGGEVFQVVSGEVHGFLLREPRGKGGFGYDPLFVPEGYAQTFAELSDQEKLTINHRGKALREAVRYLQTLAN